MLISGTDTNKKEYPLLIGTTPVVGKITYKTKQFKL